MRRAARLMLTGQHLDTAHDACPAGARRRASGTRRRGASERSADRTRRRSKVAAHRSRPRSPGRAHPRGTASSSRSGPLRHR